ncbi:hypothetical protein LVQ77_03960 [Buttiauxella sp. S04-F03]|uniref:oligogalacturonate-specific porin KdgM family protein n=1 Tax=Buttiauxella sp. W03-F01 TaxID=2904524 RepID=UPI001E57E105|nr:oligogalacturonate-specific porin KdgM family protein [Buttiauxella sp. W03-F01]MCE0799462.1 hypothetical protein [Buttiauxella sp. W03-F01]
MKKILTLSSLLISLSIHGCFAGEDYFTQRYKHFTATNTNSLELKYLHRFDNSAGVLLTAYNNLGHHFDELKSVGNEAEFWYPLYLADNKDFKIMGGGQLTMQPSGSFVCANIGGFYNLFDALTLGSRYRYVKFNHKTIDINGEENYANFHQLDYYITYKINNKWATEFNATNNIFINNFHRANGRNDNWEIKQSVNYKINDTWSVQSQIGWYERVQVEHKENYLLSMAASYKF